MDLVGQFSPAFLILLCSAVPIVYVARMLFFTRNHFPVEGRTAVITGGSSGLGLSTAILLASKGCNVAIVAQDVYKLKSAIKQISASAKAPSTQHFLDLSFDLRSPSSAPEIITRVTSWNNNSPPDIVLCCAGNAAPSFFASASIETLRSQMDTIYWSAAYMAHATLNAWLQPSATSVSTKRLPDSLPVPTRHLIFTSSTAAFIPIAGYAPYTPCKAAMRALADTLNQEVATYNGSRLAQIQGTTSPSRTPPPAADINIHTIFPMGILTPGYENENKTKPGLTKMLEESDQPQTADEVARIAVDRLERGDYMITTMLLGHLLRGVGMGASIRNGIVDLFWSLLGGLVILFVAPDLMSKCRKWGKEKGMDGAR